MSFLSGLFNRSARQGFVPQPVIPVRYYAGKHDNEDLRYALAEAVWLMSQVPTGRMLLQSMKDHGKQYVTFDEIEKNIAGTYAHGYHPKTPFELNIGGRVGSKAGFSELLSTLIHESAHARQDAQGIMALYNANKSFFRSATDVLRYDLAISHAKEAEALAMEIQVLLELSQIPLLKKTYTVCHTCW